MDFYVGKYLQCKYEYVITTHVYKEQWEKGRFIRAKETTLGKDYTNLGQIKSFKTDDKTKLSKKDHSKDAER